MTSEEAAELRANGCTETEIAEIRREEREEKMMEAVSKITDLVNYMGSEKGLVDAFYKAFVRQHRTLQASFIRMFIGFLNKYKDAGHDARNEAAVKWANEASKLPGHIPFI